MSAIPHIPSNPAPLPNPGKSMRGRALITGASRRIGRAIALRLAQSGVSLALHYRSDEEGRRETTGRLRTLGARFTWHRADLGDIDACETLISEAAGELGGLDALVNNAAHFERTPVETMSADDFDRLMRVNARSVYLLSMHAGRRMQASGGGAIVNLADVSAERPWGTHIPYCASKAAVRNMTRGFARALAPTVRVNSVSPGAALPPADARHASGAKQGPIAGHAGAEAIAAAVAFLLSASYVTGVDLVVDGGRSLLM